MQIFGLYTSQWEEGDITSIAAICTKKCDIVRCDTSDDGQDFEHHIADSIQIEHNGEYYEFECEDALLTATGKKDFQNFLSHTVQFFD